MRKSTASRIARLCALATALAIMVPVQSAYAADIDNDASADSSVKVGRSFKFSQVTAYKAYSVGAASIPFVSDWRSEVPATYFKRPVDIKCKGYNGGWSKTAKQGQYGSGKRWIAQSGAKWFYGSSTWRVTSKVTAKRATSGAKLSHGQSKRKSVSEGSMCSVRVKVKK